MVTDIRFGANVTSLVARGFHDLKLVLAKSFQSSRLGVKWEGKHSDSLATPNLESLTLDILRLTPAQKHTTSK